MKSLLLIVTACASIGFIGEKNKTPTEVVEHDVILVTHINPVDTIFDGNLYWNLDCTLDTVASKKQLDSIVGSLKNIEFDSCVVLTQEYITSKNGRSCASMKSEQVISIINQRTGLTKEKCFAIGRFDREDPLVHMTKTTVVLWGIK